MAPTPSGYLHLGNIFSFVLTWLWAKMNNGKITLRIDDIDNERYRTSYLFDIFESLSFLGLDCDAGPKSLEDFETYYSQKNRLGPYNDALHQLVAQGLVYACSCTRKEIAETKTIHACPRKCATLGLPLDTPNTAWRLRIPAHTVVSFRDEQLGVTTIDVSHAMPDFVVRQKNGLPAYQICSLVDDLQSDITHIVRGQDLVNSTAAQLYLAALLGEKQFEQVQFLHHPLLMNKDGKKMSKSAGDYSIKDMRTNGAGPEDVYKKIFKELHFKESHEKNLDGLLALLKNKKETPFKMLF